MEARARVMNDYGNLGIMLTKNNVLLREQLQKTCRSNLGRHGWLVVNFLGELIVNS